MKVTLPESAIKTLKDILKDNQERPQNIRVYFAGMGCSGASFGIALDEEREDDVCYDIEGLHFIMKIKTIVFGILWEIFFLLNLTLI